MAKMFINKDGQVYSGEAPAAPEDLEKLGPDDYMQQALTSTPVWPIEADAEAVRKKRMDAGRILEVTEIGNTPPLPGSATYPDEVTYEGPPEGSLAAFELEAECEKLSATKELREKRMTEGGVPAETRPTRAENRAEQLAREARAKAYAPPAAPTPNP